MNLIPALEPERLITGIVREQVPYTYLADFIHFIRPRTKRVLVPFYQNAEFGLYQERLELLRARFAEFGVETILLPVRAMTEVIPAVAEYMSSIDTIILPEGTFISDVTNAIADLCKQYKVMLVGHHIERTGSNPAVTFLQDAEKVGEALFDAAYQILEQGKKPSEMPIVHLPDDRQIIIDHNACYDQGVDADAIALFCANNNIIIP